MEAFIKKHLSKIQAKHWIWIVVIIAIATLIICFICDIIGSDNWMGVEAIFTITTFIISAIVFLGQRKELIYQNTTQELRNEMYVFLNSKENFDNTYHVKIFMFTNNFFKLYKKIKKHNNESLINEFALHQSTRDLIGYIATETFTQDIKEYFTEDKIKEIKNLAREIAKLYITYCSNYSIL
ncbi:hypothetical protein [Candidatus Deianiraea vastatrix]|uniref:Uncharacterized protein n=1 Tax=Candidatus Deianiraea vastatrix TaxID=2163644 RepID=A0A5B8XHB6_9RICK|nr:hypothetical protein [Candidatus Deianiraea vastatrix]QED23227.1 hypothetical protein Deia_00426 [Candidatus Deianiraea vastatrix]